MPDTWDKEIWREICGLLNNDLWIEQQLAVELNSSQEIEKLIRLQQHKITTYKSKIKKVEEGFQGSLYILEEAKLRKRRNLEAINVAQAEIIALKKQIGNSFTPDGLESLRIELKNLQDRDLKEPGFEERLDLVARLSIKVYPSEDLKSRRIKCGVNLRDIHKTGKQDEFSKVVMVGRAGLEPATP